jgi:metallo-beta-lactamase family protein
MRLSFLGATGTVTGSRYLLEPAERSVLVDCGLFQGLKQLRLRNWEPPPFDPRTIDAVVLTHAHLDHSGYLPKLVELGFRGPIHATGATADLCGLILPDSARLLEEEAGYANRHGFSKHRPALPLYTEASAAASLDRFACHAFDREFEPVPGVRVVLRRAGHLLGAASARIEWDGGSLVMSGDLGRDDDLVSLGPALPEAADTVVMESTYGDRVRGDGDALTAIAEVVNRTAARGGVVVVPSFAIGRTQAFLYAVHLLKTQHRIPDLPVFLNSPMAANASRIYLQHRSEHRLSPAQCEAMFDVARIVNSVEQSKQLNGMRKPSIIVSASGMATGGRVLHHLKAMAPDARNSLLFIGFQAVGTRGAAIVSGAAAVKIHGEYVPVRAEVSHIDLLSAHADRDGLLAWLRAMPKPPKRIFLTHGEPVAADALRLAIQEQLGRTATVPEYRDTVFL